MREPINPSQAASHAGSEGPTPEDQVRVTLPTPAVYASRAPHAFELAADLGYDGVEVMVWTDKVTQSAAALRHLSSDYGVQIGSMHAPSLVLSQRVWGSRPGPKLERSVELAQEVGARTVVVHPPFRWQP